MSWQVILWRALGGAIAILAMHFLAGYEHVPLMLVPFATSIVLVLGTPEAEPAQPRALVGGHLISTLVGLAVSYAFGPSPWAAAAAVGLAIFAMYCVRAFHPPAGIDPLIIVNESLPWPFLFTTVLPGSLLLLGLRVSLAQRRTARRVARALAVRRYAVAARRWRTPSASATSSIFFL